jgi:hypothetical protein
VRHNRSTCTVKPLHNHTMRRLAEGLRLLMSLAMTALCAACVTADHTNDRYSKDFVNRCFSTRLEAIFLSRECTKGAWKYCDTVQPISADVHGPLFDYPPTLQAYRNDPDGWSRRIHQVEMHMQPRMEPDHVTIYGGLPVGTSVRVVQLQSNFNYENGTTWIAYAVVQDGEFKGRRLLLPNGDPSVVDWRYLARCDNDTATVPTSLRYGGISGANPFESHADRYGQTGKGWLP